MVFHKSVFTLETDPLSEKDIRKLQGHELQRHRIKKPKENGFCDVERFVNGVWVFVGEVHKSSFMEG